MKSRTFGLFFFLIFILSNSQQINAQCAEQDIVNLKKIAIVFGEANYRHVGFLANPIHDASDICDSLRKVGFKVIPYYDADKKTMDDAVDRWLNVLNKYDVALFYFSGHGAEVHGQNYLFPVDANPKSSTDLQYHTFGANEMLDKIESYSNLKYSIVILDACRSNPFKKGFSRDISNDGLAFMSAKGSFIAFAASPGKTAQDGSNRNSPYTEAILKYITQPNLNIDAIFTKVNSYVKRTTVGDQTPFKYSSLGSDYCFSVSRSYKPNLKPKVRSFQQPNSKLALSVDELYLYSIGDKNDTLTIRDANSLNILSSTKTDIIHPTLLVSKPDGLVYIADSANHSIKSFDWRKKLIVDSIKMAYAPLSLFFSSDWKKIYTCGNTNGNGVVSIIDLYSNSAQRSIPLNVQISRMVVSSDLRHLYLLSKPKDRTITIVDSKTEKVVKQITNQDIGDAIGCLPDDKKLYFSSPDNSKINAFDLGSNSPVKVLNVAASSFTFTENSKYLFAIDDKKISMVNCADDEVLYEYPLASIPSGVATTTDGRGFIWLPKEQSIFTFPVLDSTKISFADSDLELKLKKFREKLNDKSFDNAINRAKLKQDSCNKMAAYITMLNQIVVPVINKIASDLNNTHFEPYQSSPGGSNCSAKIYDFHYGIRSLIDQKNAIYPNFRIHFSANAFVLTIFDDAIDKEPETFEYSLNSVNERTIKQDQSADSVELVMNPDEEIKLKKIVRNYFLKRIENLNK